MKLKLNLLNEQLTVSRLSQLKETPQVSFNIGFSQKTIKLFSSKTE
jgi:hypothetical protein